jgi:hypothetical protein
MALFISDVIEMFNSGFYGWLLIVAVTVKPFFPLVVLIFMYIT